MAGAGTVRWVRAARAAVAGTAVGAAVRAVTGAVRGGARRAGAVAAALLALLLWLPGAAHAAPGDDAGGWGFPTFTADPGMTDYADRTVELAGRLERHTGGTGSGSGSSGGGRAGGAFGETIDLVAGDPQGGGGKLLGTVTTGLGGGFRLPGASVDVRPESVGPGPFSVPVHALHRTAAGAYGDWDADAEVDVTVVPSAVRLTADFTPGAQAAAGRQVTVSGVVERAAGAGWLPVAGAAVRVGFRPDDGTPPVAVTVRTGADGGFGTDFTAAATGTVSADLGPSDDPYLDLGAARPRTAQVTVAAPTASPTAGTPTPAPRHQAAPAVRHRTATATASAPAAPAAAPTPSPSAAGQDVQPDLAATGPNGFTRAAFLTGGSTLIAAGLLLAAARRRMVRAG